MIGLLCLPLAVHARLWLLSGAWVVWIVTQCLFAAGVGLTVVGILSMPIAGLFALHTAYSTQERRRHRYAWWRTQGPERDPPGGI